MFLGFWLYLTSFSHCSSPMSTISLMSTLIQVFFTLVLCTFNGWSKEKLQRIEYPSAVNKFHWILRSHREALPLGFVGTEDIKYLSVKSKPNCWSAEPVFSLLLASAKSWVLGCSSGLLTSQLTLPRVICLVLHLLSTQCLYITWWGSLPF